MTNLPLIEFFKTHEDAVLPKRNNEGHQPGTGDTGYDVFSIEDLTLENNNAIVVPVGLKVAYVSPGYWFRVEARSGLGFKHGIFPHFGIIDNPYRGDMGIKLYNITDKDYHIKKGDRIAQLVVYQLIEPEIRWAETISETARGESGFGASGR